MTRLAHKIEIKPNNVQRTYIDKCIGTHRFVFNIGLRMWEELYTQKKEGKYEGAINGFALLKEFNKVKFTDFPWMKEVTKHAASNPFEDLESSFKRFFKKLGGYPKPKKFDKLSGSFYVPGSEIKVLGDKLKIPKLKNPIKMTRTIRFDGRVVSVTVSRRADRYFASFQIEIGSEKKCKATRSVESKLENSFSVEREKVKEFKFEGKEDSLIGVDVGVSNLFVTSEGEVVEALQPMRRYLTQLKRMQRVLSRKVKGSKNRQEQKLKLAKLHMKIAYLRNDILHKVTTHLCKTYKTIVVEDLAVKNLLKNHCMALSIADIGAYEFKRQLQYKSKLYGNNLVLVNRFFPSSKKCSRCDEIKEDLGLKDRIYECRHCGFKADRDFNASLNLKKIVGGSAPEVKAMPGEIGPLLKAVTPHEVSLVVETGIEYFGYVVAKDKS